MVDEAYRLLIPAGNEPSGCVSIHLANAARVTYPAACSEGVDYAQTVSGGTHYGK